MDANLLIYAFSQQSTHHEKAAGWLDEILLHQPRVGLPWPSLLAFLRIVTNPRIYSNPATLSEGWLQIERWLACPAAWIPRPGDHHAELLAACLKHVASANAVPDAHLAALALEHGLVMYTADAGFARFKGLRVENPIV